MTTGNTWTIQSSTKKDKIVFDEKTPVPIVMSLEAEQKIGGLLEEFPDHEWMAGLIGEVRDGYYFITDLFIPEQEGSKALIEVTNRGAAEMAEVSLLGWLHSHNTMSAFQSGTDTHTAHMYDLSITVNNKYEYYATLKVNIPVGGQMHLKCDVQRESIFFVNKSFVEAVKAKITVRNYGYANNGTCPRFPYKDGQGNPMWEDEGTSSQQTILAHSDMEKNTNDFPEFNDYHPDGKTFCGQCSTKIKGQKAAWCPACGQGIHLGCRQAHRRGCEKLKEIKNAEKDVQEEVFDKVIEKAIEEQINTDNGVIAS